MSYDAGRSTETRKFAMLRARKRPVAPDKARKMSRRDDVGRATYPTSTYRRKGEKCTLYAYEIRQRYDRDRVNSDGREIETLF